VRECGMNNRQLAHKEFTSTSSTRYFGNLSCPQ
jgi:hypothetical protein